MDLNYIEPWKTRILKINLASLIDLEALANEIFQLHCLAPRESKVPYAVTPAEFPRICELRDGLITQVVSQYIKDCYDIDPLNLAIDTFGKWFEQGTELGDHLHGNSCVTSVLYPYAYQSGMMVNDPRFNACRGYSRRVRDSHFANHFVQPEAGDLIIMPSYVMHSVPRVADELRVSLINDFHFE